MSYLGHVINGAGSLPMQAKFQQLIQALAHSIVLQLPNFSSEFVVDYNASGGGIGAVLQQHGHPISFFNKKLAVRHFKFTA